MCVYFMFNLIVRILNFMLFVINFNFQEGMPELNSELLKFILNIEFVSIRMRMLCVCQ
jgi:hypothetical protein